MQKVIASKKKYTKQNKLNDLTGKEWIKNTKSWFILKPTSRGDRQVHPAPFPVELAEKFVNFFSKKDNLVFDPFAGIGSTLCAAKKLNRNSIGIELYDNYINFAKEKLSLIDTNSESILIRGNSKNVQTIFDEHILPKIDLCITSPPYWNQLSHNHRRQQKRIQDNISTKYGENEEDLGNIIQYDMFMYHLELIFNQIYEITNNLGFLVVITNNVYKNKQFWPLAFDTFSMLSKKWIPYDEQIWCQDDKPLYPFGIFDKYVGNRCHHYCLIFQKK